MKYITDLINILRGSGFTVLIKEHKDCNTEPLEETTICFFSPQEVSLLLPKGYSVIIRYYIFENYSNLHN